MQAKFTQLQTQTALWKRKDDLRAEEWSHDSRSTAKEVMENNF